MLNYSNFVDYAKEFKNIFKLKLQDYLIPELMGLGYMYFDIVKFDDFLISMYGDYDGKSMADILKEKYGDKGHNVIANLIS